MALKEVKYLVEIIESEKDWGRKIDQIVECDSEAAREQYIADYNKQHGIDRSKPTPDWYMIATKGGTKIVDPPVILESILGL